MNNNVKLTMTSDGSFVRFRTYDRKRGTSRTFIVAKAKLSQLFTSENVIVDTDCDGYIEVYHKDDDNVFIAFSWLSVDTDNNISGYRQRVTVSTSVLGNVISSADNTTVKYLCRDKGRTKATIHSEGASKTIRQIQTDKRIKRAFSKALRDHFDWPGDVIYLYSDGLYDIYFQCEGNWPINGGLILHHCNKYGQDRVVYGVHT